MSQYAKLSVPGKDPVFKYDAHRDLGACIGAWLATRYGADLAARKSGVLAQLQALRAETLVAVGSGGKVASDDKAVRAMFAYYHCLSALELPFGEDESHGLLRVRFEWTSAYAAAKRTKAYTPQLEQVAVLFNAACALSAQACKQSDAIQGTGTAEEWKSQCHTFRAAAGVFQHIRSEFYLREPVTEDLSAPGLDALTALMIAQAQECFLEQAANQGLSLAVRAKIASGTAQCYSAARDAATHASLAELQKVVLPWVTLQTHYFAAESQLLVAKQVLEADGYCGTGVGVAIQRLRWVVAQRPSVQAAGREWERLAGGAKAERLSRFAAQDADVDRLLGYPIFHLKMLNFVSKMTNIVLKMLDFGRPAEEDNASIYFVVVPVAPPEVVEAKVFVSPLDIEENPAFLWAQQPIATTANFH